MTKRVEVVPLGRPDTRIAAVLEEGRVALGATHEVRAGALEGGKLPVWIKLARNDNEAKLLETEHAALCALARPYFLAPIALGHRADQPDKAALVLERPSGESLTGVVGSPLPLDRALGVFHRVCAAVTHLHAGKRAAQDLSPAWIFVDTKKGDLVHLVALDRACPLTEAGLLDTSAPQFGRVDMESSAPEQRNEGASVDCRADVFQLGALLYLLLTGARPEVCADDPGPELGRRCAALLKGRRSEWIWLADVVVAAMRGSPRLRPSHVGELLDLVRRQRVGGPERLVVAAEPGGVRLEIAAPGRQWCAIRATTLGLSCNVELDLRSAGTTRRSLPFQTWGADADAGHTADVVTVVVTLRGDDGRADSVPLANELRVPVMTLHPRVTLDCGIELRLEDPTGLTSVVEFFLLQPDGRKSLGRRQAGDVLTLSPGVVRPGAARFRAVPQASAAGLPLERRAVDARLDIPWPRPSLEVRPESGKLRLVVDLPALLQESARHVELQHDGEPIRRWVKIGKRNHFELVKEVTRATEVADEGRYRIVVLVGVKDDSVVVESDEIFARPDAPPVPDICCSPEGLGRVRVAWTAPKPEPTAYRVRYQQERRQKGLWILLPTGFAGEVAVVPEYEGTSGTVRGPERSCTVRPPSADLANACSLTCEELLPWRQRMRVSFAGPATALQGVQLRLIRRSGDETCELGRWPFDPAASPRDLIDRCLPGRNVTWRLEATLASEVAALRELPRRTPTMTLPGLTVGADLIHVWITWSLPTGLTADEAAAARAQVRVRSMAGAPRTVPLSTCKILVEATPPGDRRLHRVELLLGETVVDQAEVHTMGRALPPKVELRVTSPAPDQLDVHWPATQPFVAFRLDVDNQAGSRRAGLLYRDKGLLPGQRREYALFGEYKEEQFELARRVESVPAPQLELVVVPTVRSLTATWTPPIEGFRAHVRDVRITLLHLGDLARTIEVEPGTCEQVFSDLEPDSDCVLDLVIRYHTGAEARERVKVATMKLPTPEVAWSQTLFEDTLQWTNLALAGLTLRLYLDGSHVPLEPGASGWTSPVVPGELHRYTLVAVGRREHILWDRDIAAESAPVPEVNVRPSSGALSLSWPNLRGHPLYTGATISRRGPGRQEVVELEPLPADRVEMTDAEAVVAGRQGRQLIGLAQGPYEYTITCHFRRNACEGTSKAVVAATATYASHPPRFAVRAEFGRVRFSWSPGAEHRFIHPRPRTVRLLKWVSLRLIGLPGDPQGLGRWAGDKATDLVDDDGGRGLLPGAARQYSICMQYENATVNETVEVEPASFTPEALELGVELVGQTVSITWRPEAAAGLQLVVVTRKSSSVLDWLRRLVSAARWEAPAARGRLQIPVAASGRIELRVTGVDGHGRTWSDEWSVVVDGEPRAATVAR